MQSDTLSDQILADAERPEQLEALFQAQPQAFRDALPEALVQAPDALVLHAWRARFDAEAHTALAPDGSESTSTTTAASRSVLTTPLAGSVARYTAVLVGLALAAGTYAKLPGFFGIDEELFYPRHIGFFVLPAFAALLATRYRPEPAIAWRVAAGIAAAWLFMILHPGTVDSDTFILSALHAPILVWLLAGVVALGTAWRQAQDRIEYLQFTSETAVVTGLVLIGGGVLTALTIGLFEAIGVRIETWYTTWVIPYGAVAAPLVGAYLVSLRRTDQRLAPTLARIFGPLALLTLAIYLPTLVLQGANPVEDRDTLIIFNAMLVAAFALVVLILTEEERDGRAWTDTVALTLAALALVVDLVALTAILGRLLEGGLTPNRLAVLGANLLLLVHLGRVVWTGRAFLVGQTTRETVEQRLTSFLPLYAIWAALVVFVFPFVFGFR